MMMSGNNQYVMGANNQPIPELVLKSQIGAPIAIRNQTGTWNNEITKSFYAPNVPNTN